jgi:hypothetical protein
MSKIWIEAALNGPWGRERQPAIPVTVDEIVADGLAAASAGAAIIHVHARLPDVRTINGKPTPASSRASGRKPTSSSTPRSRSLAPIMRAPTPSAGSRIRRS